MFERKNDYILDMVENLGRSLGKLVVDSEDDSEPIIVEDLSDKDMIKVILKKFIYEKKYSEAEDILFKFAETREYEYIGEIGQWFYKELSVKSDNELIEGGFSRDEIEQGLKDFKAIIKL